MNNQRGGYGRGRNPWNKNMKPETPNNQHSPEISNSESRFRNAQEKLQASVKKHLQNEYESSSSDEENIESDSILQSVLKNYTQLNGNIQNLGRTQQFLENAFQSGAGICLICIATVRRADSVSDIFPVFLSANNSS